MRYHWVTGVKTCALPISAVLLDELRDHLLAAAALVGVHHRRERQRQGDDRAVHPSAQPAREPAAGGDQLRGAEIGRAWCRETRQMWTDHVSTPKISVRGA